MEKKNYYVGLDVGTDSVGYAVTDEKYTLLKFKGEQMWGVHLFDEAESNEQRRAFRTARRRLDRCQQRVTLIQELFAAEIAKRDPNFFIRVQESALYPDDTTSGASLFMDANFRDSDYSRKYPTIHHLIAELIEDDSPHDVRLVYLAVAWLVRHRGHFLSEVSKENIAEVIDINRVYKEFIGFFQESTPWNCSDILTFGEILKRKIGVTRRYKELSLLLFGTPKAPKDMGDGFPYDRDAMLKLLCGGKVAPKQLFGNADYEQVESFLLDRGDDELAPVLAALGDDAELVLRLKALYDWAVLSDALQGERHISKAKIKVYEQHKTDLADLKYLMRTYIPEKYNEMFRKQNTGKVNYEAYAKGNSAKQEEFCKYAKSLLKGIVPKDRDRIRLETVMERLEANILCPKQVNSNNRVIPYQVYWSELKAVLNNAEKYLLFLREVEDGMTGSEKILSVFEFRVPYFVGPLNSSSQHAWIVRKAEGKIYPWNFNEKVDLEACEQAFIDRMTNTCTYLPGEDVLPKMSLCYEKFQMLNELNPISVNGRKLPVEWKQRIFNELCMTRKKITKKSIRDFLRVNNVYTDEELATLSGVDDQLHSALVSHIAFKNLIASGKLTEQDTEEIIKRRTYTESKARFTLWLEREYPTIATEDRKYIGTLKCSDFGRLSRTLLCELYGAESNSETGEACSILERMWNENVTLMEVLSERYTYQATIEECRKMYFDANPKSLDERLNEMYISNAVKRPILRTLDILTDIVKANGKPPEKIFIEMARGGKAENKGNRIKSRYGQLIDLYATCDTEDVRHLSTELVAMGENEGTSRLQSDKLFLYYMQLGRCMYTGEQIELSRLGDKTYDIDHIYPQSKVKDDSVLNNKLLTLSNANGEKGDVYPIDANVRHKMSNWWKYLEEHGFITEEKYKRLTRTEPFSEAEQWGFINRQLVETRQSTKTLAMLLGERYPETKIIYVKAGLVSEFRQEFDILKSRVVNDLHHAKDAYLNIVVGNVYNERFTRQWFLANRDSYNLKVKTLFGQTVKGNTGEIVWNGSEDLGRIKNLICKKNAIHLTRYTFCRKGGFFDQMPVAAAADLVCRKKNLPTEKYGGYNKATASFFLLVKYITEKKTELMLVPVELLYADKVLGDKGYAAEYARKEIGGIINKEVLSVEFPLGIRKIKIGTVFEFDGHFRMYITGKASGGKVVGLSTFCPVILGYEWEKYIKRLERFTEKKKEYPDMVYSEAYDGVTTEKNKELYELLTAKLQNAVYRKRPANPAQTIIGGKPKFVALDVFDQAKCLLQILSVFGRVSGCDLSLIGGASKAAVITLSASLSNWKKSYNSVCVVDTSASGLYQARTNNLLEFL